MKLWNLKLSNVGIARLSLLMILASSVVAKAQTSPADEEESEEITEAEAAPVPPSAPVAPKKLKRTKVVEENSHGIGILFGGGTINSLVRPDNVFFAYRAAPMLEITVAGGYSFLYANTTDLHLGVVQAGMGLVIEQEKFVFRPVGVQAGVMFTHATVGEESRGDTAFIVSVPFGSVGVKMGTNAELLLVPTFTYYRQEGINVFAMDFMRVGVRANF